VQFALNPLTPTVAIWV